MSKWIVDIHGDIEGDYDIVAKIPDNATNGDVWLATYGGKVLHQNSLNVLVSSILGSSENDKYDIQISFGTDWWNAPYKENKDGSN